MAKWMQSSEHVAFEVRERVARITLNRPERRNALSWEMLVELRGALLEADDLKSVSAIVLEGAGRDFCAGYDMKSAYARYAAEDGTEQPYRSGSGSFDDDAWKLERFQELLRTAFVLHKPVIAKVHGHCVAGTVARLAAEMDARAHLSRAKKEFDADVAETGFKAAARKRDEPFGDGVVRPSW